MTAILSLKSSYKIQAYRKKIIFLSLLPFLISPCTSHSAPVTTQNLSNSRNASVGILVDGRLDGSGWFIVGHGLAITAAHVVAGGNRIEVLSADRGRRPARVIARDLGHDLCLLLVERREGFFPSLQPAESPPSVGTRLTLTGSPIFRHDLTISGRMAAADTQYEWNGPNGCYTEAYPVAATAARGFSGGAWTGPDGKVVGIQSGVMSLRGIPLGIVFMAPAAAAKRLVAGKQDQPAPSLGAVLAEAWEPPWPQDGRADRRRNGLTVVRLTPSSVLATAGVRKNDRILAVEGKKLL